jgi:glutamate formiminotransferase
MNIERYDLTPVHEVVSAVVAAAAERGVEVVESELVGLMPRAAAEGHAEGKLLLGQLRETDLLEGAIAAALSARQVRGNR